MKRCIVISDSFKGTLSSLEICHIAEESAEKIIPETELIALPVADGGEGTVDCFIRACGGKRCQACVSGPFGEPVLADYALLRDGTAVIEMASCAGLPLVEGRRDPLRATTFGVGELIRDAVTHGASRIILGLGGSCTNDGGCGAAAALGAIFKDGCGNSFVPTGGTLSQVKSIQVDAIRTSLGKTCITVMCDVDNPLFGKTGAACVFGPQKGADTKTVRLLDDGLRNLDRVIQCDLSICTADVPGAGAAGGFGAGAIAFFGAVLQSGIDTVLETVRFPYLLQNCSLIITGEGCLDEQSLHGKVVSGVLKQAQRANVPVVILAGTVREEMPQLYSMGASAVFSINRRAEDYQIAKDYAADNYRATLENVFRLIRCAKSAQRCPADSTLSLRI